MDSRVDTNVVLELAGPVPNRAVRDWVGALDYSELVITVGTAAEIRPGAPADRGLVVALVS